MQVQHFEFLNNNLVPSPERYTWEDEIDNVQIDSQRYAVSSNDAHTRFTIDFGVNHANFRSRIVCENAADMLQALALVRTAFPS